MSTIPASKGVSRRARRAIFLLAGIGALLVWSPLLRLLWQVVLAALLTALALPLAKAYEKRFPRPVASAMAIGTLLLFVVILVLLLTPHVIDQIKLVISEAPKLLSGLQGLWEKVESSEWFQNLGVTATAPDEWLSKLGAWLGESLPKVLSGIGAGIDTISRAFLAPVLGYYFLKDREIFGYRISLWIPLKHRKRALVAMREMRREAGGYVRGQLLVALCVGILTALGLLIVGIPAWLVLGLMMGVCELIPYVGPIIGAIPIALFSLPLGLTTLLWGLGVAIAVQQLEGYFLSPRLMAGATGLHPAYVILLLTAGGLLAGLLGMLLALPIFVCLRGAARALYNTRDAGSSSS